MTRDRRVDVLIVGAGPAGLSAAVAAASTGRHVLVIDQGLRPGGQIWRHRREQDADPRARTLLDRARESGVVMAPGCRVIDASSARELVIDYRGRVDRQQCDALVIATGARERFIPFPGWTLPGVTGVGGLQALLKSGLRVSGARVVLAGTGPLLLPVAASLAHAGAHVLYVAEQAPMARVTRFGARTLLNPSKLVAAVRYRSAFAGTPYRAGSWIARARGDTWLREVTLRTGRREITFECDWAGVAYGLVPNPALAELLAASVRHDGSIEVDAEQLTSIPGVWAAGECTGVKGDDAAIAEGAIAGYAAAGESSSAREPALQRERDSGIAFGKRLAAAFALRDELKHLAEPDTIICRCEDVRRDDVDPAWTQRQAKLWTRVGMGPCQGAVCGPACGALFGWESNRTRAPLGAPSIGEWMG